MVLLRGVIFLVVALVLLTTLVDLPAFSWLIQSMLPALLLSIPVIFAPEIRRALERLGRAGTFVTLAGSNRGYAYPTGDPCRSWKLRHGSRPGNMAR